MGRRTKYRYIGNGHCKPTDKISDYRLIGACKLHTLSSSSYIRVEIPEDLELIKWECDEYSTTEDLRTIEELGYDIVVKVKGKWKIMTNEFKNSMLGDISKRMHELGFCITKEHGYLSIEDYKKYQDDLQLAIRESLADAKETKQKLDMPKIEMK